MLPVYYRKIVVANCGGSCSHFHIAFDETKNVYFFQRDMHDHRCVIRMLGSRIGSFIARKANVAR